MMTRQEITVLRDLAKRLAELAADDVNCDRISDRCDVVTAADSLGADFVYSYRAAGVRFLREPWDRDGAREEIAAVLEAAKGLPLEIALNIGGTLGRATREPSSQTGAVWSGT